VGTSGVVWVMLVKWVGCGEVGSVSLYYIDDLPLSGEIRERATMRLSRYF
jgi:hypothetical protein